MVLKFNKGKMLVLLGFFAFFFNSVARSSFYNLTGLQITGMLGSFNWFAILSLIILAIFCLDDYIERRQVILLVLILFFSVFTVLSDLIGGDIYNSGSLGLYVLVVSILPGMLIFVPSFSDIDMQPVFKLFLQIFNIIMSALFIIGIFDYLSGAKISDFIAVYMSDSTWASLIYGMDAIYGYRLFTVIGAPLMNAFYALAMMVMNKTYQSVYGKAVHNIYFIYAVAMVAIVLSGSRAALILGVLYIIFAEFFGKKNFIGVLILAVVFLIIVNTPLFQNTVGARLNVSFSQDARTSLWSKLLSNDFGRLKIFWGGGYNYSRWLTTTTAESNLNFEYPFLMFLFDYGIIATVLYYAVFLIYPTVMLIRYKGFMPLVGLLTVFVYLQTFNGAAQYYDINIEFGVVAAFMIAAVCQKYRLANNIVR